MDDWHPYYEKNRYTISSFGWLQIEWLSKETALKVFQEKLSFPCNPEKMDDCNNHSGKKITLDDRMDGSN